MYFVDKTKNDRLVKASKSTKNIFKQKRGIVLYLVHFFFNKTLIKTSFNAKEIATIFIRGVSREITSWLD